MVEPVQQSAAVSAVIPLYNKAAHIRRALDSVLGQSFAGFELIVVDDGSTDRGGDFVREYKDKRVRLIRQENAGVSAARNRGIAEARAPWIAFLDADDAWKSRFLERAMAAIENNDHVDVVFTGLSEPGQSSSHFPASVREGPVDDYLDFFVTHRGAGLHPSTVVVRKTILDRVGAFPVGIRHGEDIDCWTRLALGDAMFYCIPEALATYHTDATNRAMNDDPREYCYCHEPILASCSRLMATEGIPHRLAGSVERFVQFMLLRHSKMLVDAGLHPESRRVLRTQCNPSVCGWNRYIRAYLRASAPPSFLTVARQAGRRFRSSRRAS